MRIIGTYPITGRISLYIAYRSMEDPLQNCHPIPMTTEHSAHTNDTGLTDGIIRSTRITPGIWRVNHISRRYLEDRNSYS